MRILYAALAGFLLGVSAFFTFIVPEVAFRVLPSVQLAPFLAGIFPRFYALTAVAGALLTLLSLVLPRRGTLEFAWPAAALLLTLFAWLWLLPAVNRAVGTPAFGALHGISLGLDLVAMLLWLLGLIAAYSRRRST
ncbi:MAG: DUF4149 domain-containing protein [Thermaerobacter sp.]|nr:DUF4149 domain-containing protein [Thermaerobacter sp.]